MVFNATFNIFSAISWWSVLLVEETKVAGSSSKIKLCPAAALSLQDVRHSAVALLLKAALIQVSDYRLRHFQHFFSYIVVVSFIGGRNQSSRRKPRSVWNTNLFCSYKVILS
jgi:hypothetical protein